MNDVLFNTALQKNYCLKQCCFVYLPLVKMGIGLLYEKQKKYYKFI